MTNTEALKARLIAAEKRIKELEQEIQETEDRAQELERQANEFQSQSLEGGDFSEDVPPPPIPPPEEFSSPDDGQFFGGPPPPPPPPPPGGGGPTSGGLPPKASGGRADLLASIQQGKKLKKTSGVIFFCSLTNAKSFLSFISLFLQKRNWKNLLKKKVNLFFSTYIIKNNNLFFRSFACATKYCSISC